jgi:hypothetical protein
MTRLCQLAEKYGCDKVKSIFHDYTPFYDELLKYRQVNRILEIGIGTINAMLHLKNYEPGASLRMWRDYFPSAEIYGLDNDPSVMFNEDRIHTAVCDQSSEDSLRRTAVMLGGKFDFILDDGSHQIAHQALTANTLIPKLLSPTGVYVIEDIILRRELYALLPWPVEVKIFNLKRTPDDCVFVIEGSKL